MLEGWLNTIKRNIGRKNHKSDAPKERLFVRNLIQVEIIFITLSDIIKILASAKKVSAVIERRISDAEKENVQKNKEITLLKKQLVDLQVKYDLEQKKNTSMNLPVDYRINYMQNDLKEAKIEVKRWKEEWHNVLRKNEKLEEVLKEMGQLSDSKMKKEYIRLQIQLSNLLDQRTFIHFELKRISEYKEVLMRSYVELADIDTEWGRLKKKEFELCKKEADLLELEEKLKATDKNFLEIFTNSYKYNKKKRELFSLKESVKELEAYMRSEKYQKYKKQKEELEQKQCKLHNDTIFLNKKRNELDKLARCLQREEDELYKESIKKQKEIYEEIEKDERMLFVIRSLHEMSTLYEVSLHILLATIKNRKSRRIVTYLLEGKSVYEVAEMEKCSPDNVRRICAKVLKDQAEFSSSLD